LRIATLAANPRETGLTGLPWREIWVLSYRIFIISRLTALYGCLENQVWARARPDIAKWHVKVKMLFIIDQLQVLFDDMFSYTCYNMNIVNIVIVLIHGFNSMVILKVVIYGPL